MKRANIGVVTGTALLGIAAICAVSLLSKRRRKEVEKKRNRPVGTSKWLEQIPESSLSGDHACVFELQDLNRTPSGRVGGAGALQCISQGFHIRINELFDVPELVLYSVEMVKGKVLLIFMQVPSVTELFKAPFLDRGVRALAEIGSRVIVAPLEAMDNLRGLTPLDQLPEKEQSRYSIIWNTGRCGSTLMHKLLQKIGVLSFSEPFWLESIFDFPYRDDAFNAKIFCVCAAVDVLLVRKSLPAHPPIFGAASTLGSGYVSFNPKGRGAVLMAKLVELLPHAKHMLMYRDARKVAESFGSIMHHKPPFLQRVITILSPRPRLKSFSRGPPHKEPPMPTLSMAVAEAKRSGRLNDPTKLSVKSVTSNWLETICVWKELIERGTLETDSYVSLRMEDFIRKLRYARARLADLMPDPELIEEILRFFLGAPLEVGEDAVALALESFNKHSQQGDPMSRSSHLPGSGVKKFLTPMDLKEIEQFVAAVPSVGAPDFVFPDSMGLKK